MSDLRTFCDANNILGRLLMAYEGVNGTVSGLLPDIQAFKAEFIRLIPEAASMPWKRSSSQEVVFRDMFIKQVKELVGWGLGIPMENREKVNHLTPSEFHDVVKNKKDEIVLLDIRNQHESALGHFDTAITPESKNMP